MELDKGYPKKLKRGLQDLSPLFQAGALPHKEQPAFSFHPPFEVQFLTVCIPDHEGDAFLVNAYVASQIVRRYPLFASLISIVSGVNASASKTNGSFPHLELLNSRISRVALSHQELWGLSKNDAVESGVHVESKTHDKGDFLIFLEFEPTHFRSLARIALLLDRLVLFVPAGAESLREAYRLCKIFWSLNRDIEFFLLFQEGDSTTAREAFLFERFSLITSRFLGTFPRWLGNLSFPDKNGRTEEILDGGSRFNVEALLAREGLRRPLTPEKNRFWHHFKEILGNRIHQDELTPKHA